MRMVAGAVLPAFNHPLKLAGQLAMLDALCGGRLDVGVARAFMPYEFDSFGVSLEESRPRFEEGIKALRRLWTEERVTFEGRFHRFRDVTVLPRPTQTGLVMMVLHLYVAPTSRAAREEGRPYMEQYLHNFRASARAWTGRQSGQYKAYSGLEQMLDEITYDRVLAETRAIIGDPEDTARQIEYVRDTFGDVHASFQINFGVMEEPRARRSIELFAHHVMPRFR
jgi:alkanesulfonate monooxygenase SsuD/methylene tetrahydromethanopterin reductase-like flavin-dependent oxidoreductase (luciferase family)